jgi:FAD/FMN-containing dehydrogenase
MYSKLYDYLKENLTGEVIINEETRKTYSTDGSIFNLMPGMVVKPFVLQDVRKMVRLLYRMAEKGKIISLTSRGSGTDQSGGAITDGIIVDFTSNYDRLLHLDINKQFVTVQPGINFGLLQTVLQTHGYYLPFFPSSYKISTIGGAIANNASGERSFLFGSTRDHVIATELVLCNGDVITTQKLTNKELALKKAQNNFEGQIYRKIDELISSNFDKISKMYPNTTKNSSGYCLNLVKTEKTFDLTPLIVGSQGTLGVITAATLRIENYNANAHLFVFGFKDVNQMTVFCQKINTYRPVAIEVFDDNLIKTASQKLNIDNIKLFMESECKFFVLVEYDDSEKNIKKSLKLTNKAVGLEGAQLIKYTSDYEEREIIWKIRRSAASLLDSSDTKVGKKALPIIEDGCVPIEKLPNLFNGIYQLFEKMDLAVAVWGHGGDANLHIQPLLDLHNLSDRQKAFKLMDEYYNLVLDLGGTITGEHNDGRLRAPYLKEMFGEDGYDILLEVKHIFDPYGFMNKGVKFGTDKTDLAKIIKK